MSAVASDRELIELLAERAGGREVLELSRKPYRYATSAPLEELHVRMEDGEEMALIFKDLSRDRLLGDAPAAKPEFLHQPRREVETYRRVLAPAGIGPRCLAAVAESDPERYWLVIEKVPGVELWQVGELEVWEEVAGWLARFHSRFAGRRDELRDANPYLLEHSNAWFRSWRERAEAALAHSTDPRAPRLEPALGRYEEVVEALAALPRTFVHGELYASNVLVVRDRQPVCVYPVDWEMAAIGPGLVDLAALIGGWSPARQRRLVAAYLGGLPDPGAAGLSSEALPAELARCRLHLALQMLGWAPHWRPPPEHAHDWLGEALSLARDLELS
jgi:Phosphotransferase enzyme family